MAAMDVESTRSRRLAAKCRLAAFALAGAAVALFAAGHVDAKVGPFDTTVSARPSLAGYTAVRLAPLGSIEFDTHDGRAPWSGGK